MSRLAPLLGLLLVLLLAAPARSATVVSAPLDTLITSGPGNGEAVYDDTITFEFAATGQGAESAIFQCSLDGGAPAPCPSSGQTYGNLAGGPHSFSVYAEEPVTGLRDTEPAGVAFTVEGVVCDEGESDAEDQVEGEEEGGCEEEAGADLPPRECVIRTSRASALANLEQGRLRVTIRYTAFESSEATVDARLGSGHGAPRLLQAHRHLAKQGRLVLSSELSKGELAKLRGGKGIGLELTVPGAPSSCARYGDRHLVPTRVLPGRVLWAQTESQSGRASS